MACDYTIMGEEYFAVTAYLSREPSLLGSIRAGDVVKYAALVLIVIGTCLAIAAAGATGPTAFSVFQRLVG